MNEDRRITEERKAQFREVLYEGEKSRATIEKYMRDLEKLEVFLSAVWAYFGFTEQEVDWLYGIYLKKESGQTNRDYPQQERAVNVSRTDLEEWYNGYHTLDGKRLYNPRSVMSALQNNQVGSYWTGSGTYDSIFYYIQNNIEAVKDDLALMISGEHIPVRIQEYAYRFQGKMGESSRCTERILAVGIGYEKKSKEHRCLVEVLRGKIE